MDNALKGDEKGILRYYIHSRVIVSLELSLTLVLIIALMDRMGSTPTNSTRWSSVVRDENFLKWDKTVYVQQFFLIQSTTEHNCL